MKGINFGEMELYRHSVIMMDCEARNNSLEIVDSSFTNLKLSKQFTKQLGDITDPFLGVVWLTA